MRDLELCGRQPLYLDTTDSLTPTTGGVRPAARLLPDVGVCLPILWKSRRREGCLNISVHECSFCVSTRVDLVNVNRATRSVCDWDRATF